MRTSLCIGMWLVGAALKHTSMLYETLTLYPTTLQVDVWSVGVIHYQMLYGRRPFGEGVSQETLLRDSVMLNANTITFPSKPTVSAEGKDFISRQAGAAWVQSCKQRCCSAARDVRAICHDPPSGRHDVSAQCPKLNQGAKQQADMPPAQVPARMVRCLGKAWRGTSSLQTEGLSNRGWP